MPASKTLVAIGVPSGDTVHTDFAMSLAMLCMNHGAQSFLLNSRSSLVPLGRNQCVGGAQIMKATHILFLDTDMVFPADTLERLLAHDKDIVGATYSQRMPPFGSLAIAAEGAQVANGLQAMNVMPVGCMLIRIGVFNALTHPYFNLTSDGDQLQGEHYSFCAKARAAGFDIWCDTDLSNQIGHIGQKIYRLAPASDVAMHNAG